MNTNDKDLIDEQNAAIEKEVAELLAVGVPEWQARETAAINLGLASGDVVVLRDPDLTDKENEELDRKIEKLISVGWSEHQAREAAPIMLGLSDGDVIELEEDEAK